ncbi:DUF4124 domain-containing protein [Pseudomonas sp. M30-35]|uniref:DUF4124 domain-containing protein n=1 Tax=Pseudomonas sp. M30-35 TaxID=1981174 RepID=UPI000B3D2B14|nr:DUF4124 domain-containing protein [Pseudomonas sp. M30-35]ARU89616.1 DUF4124 domain-containing protein [Pseudomonas sp. M30-35]
MRLLLCLLLLPGLAAAEIYRWTDAKGQVHFGQRPTEQGATVVEVKPQVVERDQATRDSEQRSERFYDARRQEQAQADAASAQRRSEREAQCQKLRSSLAQMPEGRRYYRVEASGARTYYSDAQLDQARAQLREKISSRCL